MPLALPELAPIVLLLVALGLAILATLLVKALFSWMQGTVSWLPGVGGVTAAILRKIEATLTGALGTAEAGIDKLMGAAFHILSKQWDWLWSEIKSHAKLLGMISPLLAAAIYAIEHIRGIAHGAHGAIIHLRARVKSLDKEYKGIEHRVRQLEKEFGKGIGHDLRTKVAGLEDDLTKLEGKVIPGLRTAVGTAETDAQRALREVGSIPFPAGAKTWAEAIAVALPALGLEWLRCNSNPFNGNKAACNLWGDLAGLLGLATLVIGIEDFRELVKLAQTVEREVTVGVQDLLKV